MTLLTALVVESTGRVDQRALQVRADAPRRGRGGQRRYWRGRWGSSPPSLVTLALVRKARILAWTAVGIALLFRRGLSVRRALDQAQSAAGEEGS